MIRSIRVQLLPNNKQKTKLFQFAGAARYAYNWALDKQMDNFREGRKLQTDHELRKAFTLLRHSEENKWLLDISNNVTKQAIKDLCIAYKNFFHKQKQPIYIKYSSKKITHYNRIGKSLTVYDMNGHPKFRSKKNGDFRFYQDNVKIQFTGTHVKLESLAGSRRKNRQRLNWVRLAERNRIPVRAKYTNPRIAFDGERWWLSVGIQTARKLKPLRGLSFVCKKRRYARSEGIGIDLGIKDLAVLSDATKVGNINKTRAIRKLKKKRRRLQRQVSQKYQMNKKGDSYCKTSNLIKSEKRLLRINHRLANIRQNHVHQATTSIIKRKPSFVCLEDLNVRGMMKNRYLSEKIQEQNLYEFRRQIEYKAHWAKIPVVIADRWYPSSKTCVICGHVKKELNLLERTYICPVCGNIIDRDFQAALNLKRYGEAEQVKLANY
ncbi:transposase [Mitsuokella sp. AF33-22]|uniref:RNA-guided endonuclease InsQ/TnpB family protein n=1 Tax=Mitsuokella sp. AF33-22 TaxID=2292047 RepID=UPI000E4C6F14|nr:RNA-guided endonuclease TnpB family protein [Mitsuokella sp. AF33-22]RHM55346.1 transposase [Mitsuokella sp. AF33-22]